MRRSARPAPHHRAVFISTSMSSSPRSSRTSFSLFGCANDDAVWSLRPASKDFGCPNIGGELHTDFVTSVHHRALSMREGANFGFSSENGPRTGSRFQTNAPLLVGCANLGGLDVAFGFLTGLECNRADLRHGGGVLRLLADNRAL